MRTLLAVVVSVCLGLPCGASVWNIPHIAGENWTTTIEIFNPGSDDQTIDLYRWDSDGTSLGAVDPYVVPGEGTLVLTNADFGFDGIARITGDDGSALQVKLSYRYGTSHSLCEFFIPTTVNRRYMIPNPVYDHMDWFGLAIANFSSQGVDLTLTALRDGEVVSTAEFPMDPWQKLVNLSDFLLGAEYEFVDMVLVSASADLVVPLSITGNTAQDRHVFFSGIPLDDRTGASRQYMVPHIAESGWSTDVTVYNPSDIAETGSYTSYNPDGSIYESDRPLSIPARDSVILSAGTELPYGGTALVQVVDTCCVKLAYRYGSSESLCEFFLADTMNRGWLIPNSQKSWFDWFGMGLCNPYSTDIEIVLQAWKDGSLVAENAVLVDPHTKLVDLSSGLWPARTAVWKASGIAYADVDTVTVNCDRVIPPPISITGNQAQNRHVFFPGSPFDLSDSLDLQWESLQGPEGGGVVAFGADPFETDHLYAGTVRGLYRSTDRGNTWTLIDATDTWGVSGLAFSEHWVYVVVNTTVHQLDRDTEALTDLAIPAQKLFTSDGRLIAANGVEFQTSVTLSQALAPFSIQVASLSDAVLSWTDITPSESTMTDLVSAYVGQSEAESRWVGATCAILSGSRSFLCIQLATNVVANDPPSNSMVDKVLDELLLFSDDDGVTWEAVTSPFESDLRFIRMAQDPLDPSSAIAAAGPFLSDGDMKSLDKLLMQTTDTGETWSTVTPINAIIAPFVSDIDYYGSDLYLTHVDQSIVRLYGTGYDQYQRWGAPSVPSISTGMLVGHLDFDPNNAPVVYARNGGIGMIRSDDFMNTWSVMRSGIVCSQIANITTHPLDANVIFTSNNRNYLPQKTADFGEHWETLTSTSSFSDELQIDPYDSDHVLLIDELSNIQASFDLGDSFTNSSPQFLAHRIFDLDATESGDGVLFASLLGTGVSVFDDLNSLTSMDESSMEDDAWQHMYRSSDYAYDLEIDPDDPDVLYATYSPKIFETHASLMKYDAAASENSGWSEILKVSNATGMTSVAVDPSDSRVIYAGLTGQKGLIYRTADGGTSWTTLNDTFTFATIHAMAIDPDDGSTAYAAPWGGGLFRTVDGGVTWSELKTPTPSIAEILVDPSDTSRLVIGDRTSPAIYVSEDAGANWSTLVQLDTDQYYRIFSLAFHGDALVFSAMTRNAGVIGLFDDGPFSGQTFRMAGTELVQLAGELTRGVLAFCSTGDDLYAVTHLRGVYRLDGSGWVDISGDLPDMGFNSLTVGDDGALYLCGGCDLNLMLQHRVDDMNQVFEIYRSMDGGGHWEGQLQTNPFQAPIKQLFFDPGDPDTWIVATTGGVYTTSNGGADWTAMNTGLDFTAIGAMVLGSGGTIYAGTLGGGVYTGMLSDGGSIAWSGSSGPYPKIYHVQVKVDPADGDTLYASAYPGGVFKSTDAGVTWTECNFGLPSFRVTDPTLQGYYSLEIDPNDTDHLMLGVFSRGIYNSTSGAATWYPLYGASKQNVSIMQKGITRIEIDPTDSNTVYLSTHSGMYRSLDGGENWTDISAGLDTTDVLSIDVSESGQVFVGTAGYGIYGYNESESRFVHMERALGFGEWAPWERRLYQYSALLFDPHIANRVYLGNFPGGFYISADGGSSWEDHSLGLGNDGIFSLVMHPQNPDRLFAGTYNGVVRSEDRGLSWAGSRTGLPSEQWPFTVAIDPQHPEIMYLSSKNGQNAGFCERNPFCGIVMKSVDGGNSWFKIMNGLSKDYEYYSLLIHPENTNLLFLTSNYGVFTSKNGGYSWTPANDGLPVTYHYMRDNVAQNLKFTHDLNYLILGVTDYGTWYADIRDIIWGE